VSLIPTPLSFLSTLGNRAFEAWQFIQGGVSIGLSANDIVSALSDLGLGVRRTNALSAIRAAVDIFNSGARLSALDPNIPPLPDFFAQSPGNQTEQYNYTLRGDVFNPATGRPETTYQIYATDRLLTRSELEDYWRENLATYGWDFISFGIESATARV